MENYAAGRRNSIRKEMTSAFGALQARGANLSFDQLVPLVGSRASAILLRFRLAVAPRFLWVGIELGRAGLEGGGLPSSPFRSARRVHNSPKVASPAPPPYNAGRPSFSVKMLSATFCRAFLAWRRGDSRCSRNRDVIGAVPVS